MSASPIIATLKGLVFKRKISYFVIIGVLTISTGETEHPSYLVAHDTYNAGTIKGVGRIYQQTVIDTHTRVAFDKLYASMHAITAADVLNV